MALLRVQIDSQAAEQLELSERVGGTGDSFVALHVDTHSAFSELTTLVLTAHNSVRELDAKQLTAEATLRTDINNAVIRLEGTACNCPRDAQDVPARLATAHCQEQEATVEQAEDHLEVVEAATRSTVGATFGAHRAAPTAPEAVAAEEVDHPEAEVEGHLAEEAQTATASAPRTEMPVQW